MLSIGHALKWMSRVGLGIVALTGGVLVAAVLASLGLPGAIRYAISCTCGMCLGAGLVAMVRTSDKVWSEDDPC